MCSRSIRGVQLLVTASFTSAVPKTAPDDIVYLPVGVHEITPSVNGKAQKVVVRVPAEKGELIAAALQTALQKRLESPVRPRLAFDHAKTGPAAAHPKEFRFDPERGIVLALDWSNSGRAAIEGGDYGYFSPTFLIDSRGQPTGLPDKGEIGSLVDEPAFRTIGLIAAADATEEPSPTTNQNTMPKLILSALKISEAAENAEGEAVSRIQAMQEEVKKVPVLEAENESLKTKLEAAETKLKEQSDKRAADLVKAAVLDGRILPKDEKGQGFYKRLIAAGDAEAEEALAALPKLNEGLEKDFAQQPEKGDAEEGSPYDRVQAHFAAEIGEK